MNLVKCAELSNACKTHLNWSRRKLEWISEQLGIKTQEDWYSLGIKEFRAVAGENILRRSNYSLERALKDIYPEYNWDPLRFRVKPRNSWKLKSNHRKMMDWLGEQLGVQKQSDWYNFTVNHVKHVGGEGLLRNCYSGSLFHALKTVYPEFEWNQLLCVSAPKSCWKSVNESHILSALESELGAGVLSRTIPSSG